MIDIDKIKKVLPEIVALFEWDSNNYLALAKTKKEEMYGSGVYLLNKNTGNKEAYNPSQNLDKFNSVLNDPIWVKK